MSNKIKRFIQYVQVCVYIIFIDMFNLSCVVNNRRKKETKQNKKNEIITEINKKRIQLDVFN